ncbi:MAG: helix-turn-helix transcriptional regulator, partial [Clostridia bacterium]|nr:helix-turn-helix transcriptional regulator [Clostridia bacterium]
VNAMSYNIGLRLYNLRKAARLSQEQTALAANITPAYLGQIERNEKNPTILTIEKLCTVFNISLSEFFSNHKPASNDDVFLNRITVMLSNRTDVEKEKIYRLIKTALSLSDTD